MSNIFFGTVVDVESDPLKLGRIKVRIHGAYDQIDTDDLPWATCLQPIQSAADAKLGLSPTGIKVGSEVACVFVDTAMQIPFVLGSFAGQGDVAPLAQGTNTVQRTQQIPFEPRSSYKAVYPHNKTFTTASGHVIEVDDSPGAERINVVHKSGSYLEMRPDGSVVIKAVNDMFNLVAGEKSEYTKGNEVKHVQGTVTLLAQGKVNVTSLSAVDIRAPTIYLNDSLPSGHVGEITTLEGEVDRDEDEVAETKISLSDYRAQVTLYNSSSAAPITVESTLDIDPAVVSRNQTLIYPDCGQYNDQSTFTSRSSFISVRDLTTNVVTGGYQLPPTSKSWARVNGTITKSAIICNLAALSQNVILPIFDKFGRETFGGGADQPVNSGYRSATGTSWHNGGCAVDLQLASNPTAKNTIDVIKWIINNVNFDMLILEYSAQYFPNAWIHISFDRKLTRQRKLVRTIDTRTGATINGIVVLS